MASTIGTGLEREMKIAVKEQRISPGKSAYVSHPQQFFGLFTLNGRSLLLDFSRRTSTGRNPVKLGAFVCFWRSLAAPAMVAALLCGSPVFAAPSTDAPVYGVRAASMPASDAAPQAQLRGGNSIDFTGLLGNQFTTTSPFATTAQTALGNFTASGYVVDTTTPRLLQGLLVDRDVRKFSVRDLSVTASLADGIQIHLGYNVDMAGRFNGYDARGSAAYDGLFYSASGVNSPYASLADGGNFVGATVALADDLHFNIGEVSLAAEHDRLDTPVYSLEAQLQNEPLYGNRAADEKLAGVTWDFASWGGLGVVASQTSEHNGVLERRPSARCRWRRVPIPAPWRSRPVSASAMAG